MDYSPLLPPRDVCGPPAVELTSFSLPDQAARKKLENRRLAYDASLTKMQRAKREDFRLEEELRTNKAKYEESSEDVSKYFEAHAPIPLAHKTMAVLMGYMWFGGIRS